MPAYLLALLVAGSAGTLPSSGTPVEPSPERKSPSKSPSIHAKWDRLLKTYVTEDGWVDYQGLRARDAAALKAYLNELARTDVENLGSREARMAFWINAYNAVCVQTLIDHGLPAEVPHAFFFGANIFKEETYEIAGKVRSLDDIEHGILRPRFKDNRIHAAVVCGASSCPRLRPEAYEGARLNEQLDEEAHRWVSEGKDRSGKRKNYLDRGRKTFYASKIFDWYMEDFGDSEAGVRKFILRFAEPEVRQFMTANEVRLRYLDYDWRLNRQ